MDLVERWHELVLVLVFEGLVKLIYDAGDFVRLEATQVLGDVLEKLLRIGAQHLHQVELELGQLAVGLLLENGDLLGVHLMQ